MSRKLELVREEKLFRLLPGRKKSSRLEASGVALLDHTTALVVFDNLNQVAHIDLSLKRRASNRLLPAPSLGSGFEDIAIDYRRGRAFCLIEAVEDFDGLLRGFVAEYDRPTFVMVLARQRRQLTNTRSSRETDGLGCNRESRAMDSVATACMASGRARSSPSNRPSCGTHC
jgi:hypothetical protein